MSILNEIDIRIMEITQELYSVTAEQSMSEKTNDIETFIHCRARKGALIEEKDFLNYLKTTLNSQKKEIVNYSYVR